MVAGLGVPIFRVFTVILSFKHQPALKKEAKIKMTRAASPDSAPIHNKISYIP